MTEPRTEDIIRKHHATRNEGEEYEFAGKWCAADGTPWPCEVARAASPSLDRHRLAASDRGRLSAALDEVTREHPSDKAMCGCFLNLRNALLAALSSEEPDPYADIVQAGLGGPDLTPKEWPAFSSEETT